MNPLREGLSEKTASLQSMLSRKFQKCSLIHGRKMKSTTEENYFHTCESLIKSGLALSDIKSAKQTDEEREVNNCEMEIAGR